MSNPTDPHPVSLDQETKQDIKKHFATYRQQGLWTPEALAFFANLRKHPDTWQPIREMTAQAYIYANELEKAVDGWTHHDPQTNGVSSPHTPGTHQLVRIDFMKAFTQDWDGFFATLHVLDAQDLLRPANLSILATCMEDFELWHKILDITTSTIPSRELEEAVQNWRKTNPKSIWDTAVDATWFSKQPSRYTPTLVRDVLYPGCLTMVSAPRGTGKSLATMAMVIAAATRGSYRSEPVEPIRVLYIDRDNPPEMIKERLKGWGATGQNINLITRDNAPSLVDHETWAKFPADLYDAVIIDSFGASTIG